MSTAELREGQVLPESRLKDSKGVVRGAPWKYGSTNWVPIFCANCGKPQGYVPEENCTFACWLCDPCSEVWGELYMTALMPDEVFWAKVAMEQLERYGRILTKEEFQVVAESTWGALPKLLRDKG